MFRLFFCFSLSFLFFTSCKKDDSSSQNIEEENFYALTVGNTWEYEVSRYNSISEEYELLDMLLKVEITETQIVNGQTYFRFQTTASGADTCEACMEDLGENELRRDSLGYLINDSGVIKFSNVNLEDYLISDNEWGDVFGVLKEGVITVDTPAGNFETLQNDRYAIMADGEISVGTDASNYSERVGLVFKSTTGVSSPNPLYQIKLKSVVLED